MPFRLLELFCGTKSVGKVFEREGWEVVSVDIEPKFKPTHCVAIEDFEYKDLGPFDAVWASPPCCQYSSIKSVFKGRPGMERDLVSADRRVKKALEIIDYFAPKYWFIENPRTGMLKDREFMAGLPYKDVTYCHYGFTYKKETRIWTNLEFPAKFCRRDCGQMDPERPKAHRAHVLVGSKKWYESTHKGKSYTHPDTFQARTLRYRIPEALVEEIFRHLESSLRSPRRLSLRCRDRHTPRT